MSQSTPSTTSRPSSRRVVFMDDNGRIWTEEAPLPPLGFGELLIEVRASLVSPGTELGGVKGRRARRKENPGKRAFGYSNAGVLAAKGEGCDQFEIGDRLAGMGGGYALHATHANIPQNLCAKMLDSVSYEEGAACHLAATALHAVQRGRIGIAENVAVAGLGMVGQLVCQTARIAGAHVLGLDVNALRLETALRAGADRVENAAEMNVDAAREEFTNGYGFDCGVIAFGGDATGAFRQLRSLLKISPDGHKMGRIVIVGGASIQHGFAAGAGNIDVVSAARTGPGYHDEAYERGAHYPPVFVPRPTQRNLETVLRFMAEGRLDVKTLITDMVPIDRAAEACEKLIQTPDQALGVVFTMNGYEAGSD
ncbi:MAG: zinc-binding alcohol dehydrogenase [Candidatus Poribacteria bacterium]|nr:zinc-binding alcohol dehydrogenase [Candidatus Poribacteria bacterium]